MLDGGLMHYRRTVATSAVNEANALDIVVRRTSGAADRPSRPQHGLRSIAIEADRIHAKGPHPPSSRRRQRSPAPQNVMDSPHPAQTLDAPALGASRATYQVCAACPLSRRPSENRRRTRSPRLSGRERAESQGISSSSAGSGSECALSGQRRYFSREIESPVGVRRTRMRFAVTVTTFPMSSSSPSDDSASSSASFSSDTGTSFGKRATMIPACWPRGKRRMLPNPTSPVTTARDSLTANSKTSSSGRPRRPASRTSTASKPSARSRRARDRGRSSSTT